MLAADLDFYRIFKMHPTVMGLLTADFVIIDVNDEFVRTVGWPLEEMIGRNIFDVLPKMPKDPGGHPKWTALEAAATSGRREEYRLSRYDLEVPGRPGVFEERYWTSAVQPIHGLDGQIDVLEFSAREVTNVIEQYRALQAEWEA